MIELVFFFKRKNPVSKKLSAHDLSAYVCRRIYIVDLFFLCAIYIVGFFQCFDLLRLFVIPWLHVFSLKTFSSQLISTCNLSA